MLHSCLQRALHIWHATVHVPWTVHLACIESVLKEPHHYPSAKYSKFAKLDLANKCIHCSCRAFGAMECTSSASAIWPVTSPLSRLQHSAQLHLRLLSLQARLPYKACKAGTWSLHLPAQLAAPLMPGTICPPGAIPPLTVHPPFTNSAKE